MTIEFRTKFKFGIMLIHNERWKYHIYGYRRAIETIKLEETMKIMDEKIKELVK